MPRKLRIWIQPFGISDFKVVHAPSVQRKRAFILVFVRLFRRSVGIRLMLFSELIHQTSFSSSKTSHHDNFNIRR